MIRLAKAIAAVFGLMVVLAFLGLPLLDLPVMAMFFLATGWAFFLWRSAGEVTISPAGVTTGLIALTLFVAGLHWLLRWLRTANTPALWLELKVEIPAWPLRSTVCVAALVLMMFTAGIAIVGVAHQLAWMATSKERLLGWSGRGWRERVQSSNNMKQIALGVLMYDQTRGAYPAGATVDSQGRALHSWQTTLLPFLEETALYQQIDLTRPWDDPVNADHFRQTIHLYINPSVPSTTDITNHSFGISHYAGNSHVLGSTQPLRPADFKDGPSKTILAGEAAGNFVPWGKPGNWRDPAIGVNRSADGFGGNRRGATLFVMADGSVQTINDDIDPRVLKAISTPAGGEKVNLDDF